VDRPYHTEVDIDIHYLHPKRQTMKDQTQTGSGLRSLRRPKIPGTMWHL